MNSLTETPAFYTVEQLAIRWQISARSIRRLIKSGKVKTTRFGRNVRIADYEVCGYEDENYEGGAVSRD